MVEGGMVRAAAWGFAGLAALVVGFHLLVIAGAPWGALTMGGRWPGVLPWPARGLSGMSALMIAGMAAVVLARARVLPWRVPRWAMAAVLGLSVLGVVARMRRPLRERRGRCGCR